MAIHPQRGKARRESALSVLAATLDARDYKILNLLLEQGRFSYREIAKKAGMSVVTVINRVRELEKRKIIKNFSVNLDYEQAGYDIQAVISLRIARGKLFEVEQRIAVHPNVSAVYDTTGNFDSLVIARFKNRRGLDAFLKKIQTYDFVERTDTRLVLNTITERSIAVE